MRPRLIRSPGQADAITIGKWCAAVRVWVSIEPGDDAGRDGDGLGLHCVWEIPTPDGADVVHKGYAPGDQMSDAVKHVEVLSDCGTFMVRGGGRLRVRGGTGEWRVLCGAAAELVTVQAPTRFALIRPFVGGKPLAALPFAHTHLEVIAGDLLLGGVPLPPGQPIPRAVLASEIETRGDGWIRSWVEL